MSEVLKILAVGLVTVFACIIVKQTKPEFAIIISIVGSILIIIMTVESISTVVKYFYNIFEITNIDADLFLPLFKIIAIGYIAEFGANICIDSGHNSIADKILFSSKIIILIVSLPVVTNVVNLIMELLWLRKRKIALNFCSF